MLASLIARRWGGRQADFKLFTLFGLGRSLLSVACSTGVQTAVFRLQQVLSNVVWRPGLSITEQLIVSVSSLF